MRRRNKAVRCRICGSTQPKPDSPVCEECAEYGVWWDQVSRRPAMEVTGEIGVAELSRLVDQRQDRVRVMLNSAEAAGGGGRLLRYLGRGPDLLPVVVAIVQDTAGLSIAYRDRNGNQGELWRPNRMSTEVVVDAQPVRVTL